EIRNRGIEVSLDYSSTADQNDFAYQIGGNLAITKNQVENSPYKVLTTGAAQGAGQTGSTINGYLNGEPMGAFYMKDFTGIDAKGFSYLGDVKGDGKILDDDRTVVGSATPDTGYEFHRMLF